MTTEQSIQLQSLLYHVGTLRNDEVIFQNPAWTIPTATLKRFQRAGWLRVLPTRDVKLTQRGVRRALKERGA
jgi:hypothetical protein